LKVGAKVAMGAGSAVAVAALLWIASYEAPRGALDPSRGGPLVVLDRHGAPLRSVPSPGGRPGREAWTKLEDVPSMAVLTLLAGEDKRFFEHHGVDGAAVLRALYLNVAGGLNVSGGGQRYGASTLTMQLARMLHSEGQPRSLLRKVVETRAALGLERALTKSEILEQYLNRAYFGHGAYGIHSAAKTYFGKDPKALSDAEATALLVLPRGPATYDPFKHPDRLRARRRHLLSLLERDGKISADAVRAMESEPLAIAVHTPPFVAPHFVDHVLEAMPEEDRGRGGTITTTLDLRLERILEERLRRYVAEQRVHGVTEAAVVVLSGDTAEVLAMVGSRDYGENSMNLATWRRSPGSALKPFVYGVAIEEGASPATVAFDVREVVPHYRVEGFPVERGPVRIREALAGSLNFAALDVIGRAGVDDVAARLRLAGVGELPLAAKDYGERLALGATRVRLLDLAAGYRAFVYGGRVRRPSVLRADVGTAAGDETEVFDPVTAYLVMDMLSDADARRAVFGDELPVDLPYPVVAKTGTARGFSDTVSVIATRELIVAAWVGRTDGHATEGRLGMETAAPLARDALLIASRGANLSLPERPAGIVTANVCALSGMAVGDHCTHEKHELFRAGTVPTERCSWHGTDRAVHYPAILQPWSDREPRLASRL
jgi:penicillin-binding protein 1C